MCVASASVDLTLATDTIDRAGAAITMACRRDPGADVPTCPGWTVRDLTAHVAQIHRWAAGLVQGNDPGPLPEVATDLDVADWADEGRHVLTAALATADPDRTVWTFVGPQPARWWWRRQANETAVHAWDATAGAGSPWSIPPEVAADGLDEVLSIFLGRRWGHKPPTWGEGRTVHLHRTDGEGEWSLTISPSPTIEHGHAKADLAVRGPITDLLLWSIGRRLDGYPAVEVFGDEALAEAWQANVRI